MTDQLQLHEKVLKILEDADATPNDCMQISAIIAMTTLVSATPSKEAFRSNLKQYIEQLQKMAYDSYELAHSAMTDGIN